MENLVFKATQKMVRIVLDTMGYPKVTLEDGIEMVACQSSDGIVYEPIVSLPQPLQKDLRTIMATRG